MQKNAVLLVVLVLLHSTVALYINSLKDVKAKTARNENEINKMNDRWNYYKQKLHLTQNKVDIIKSQKDPEATIKMLDTFIKENPQYTKPAPKQLKSADPFQEFYNALTKELQKSKQILKTSLNFELADTASKQKNRPRRKISVKLVSDLSSDKIDDLLKAFIQEHGIDINEENENDEDMSYEDIEPLPTTEDTDFTYENLYEDGEDAAMPWSSSHTVQRSSFQELINMATHKRMQQEEEETKLMTKKSYFF